jgi:hypothetical protein
MQNDASEGVRGSHRVERQCLRADPRGEGQLRDWWEGSSKRGRRTWAGLRWTAGLRSVGLSRRSIR